MCSASCKIPKYVGDSTSTASPGSHKTRSESESASIVPFVMTTSSVRENRPHSAMRCATSARNSARPGGDENTFGREGTSRSVRRVNPLSRPLMRDADAAIALPSATRSVRPNDSMTVSTTSRETPRGAGASALRGVSREVVDTVIESFGRTDLVALGSAIAASASRINGRLNGLTRRTLRDVPSLPNVFSSPPGLAELRAEVAKRMALCGLFSRTDDVVITNGTMEALSLSLRVLCEPGDAVLVESPTYFGILQLAEHMRLKVVEVPNHPGSGIDVDALERAVRS